MDARFGFGVVVGLLIMWLVYRDWRKPPKGTWPQVDHSEAAKFKRIVSGRLQ